MTLPKLPFATARALELPNTWSQLCRMQVKPTNPRYPLKRSVVYSHGERWLSIDKAGPFVNPRQRARLRRNQRNSRARKQQYLHDLEHRWSECVRLGVQASAEIQKEARRVHEENKALRCIVREMGVSDDALRHRLSALLNTTASSPAAATQVCLAFCRKTLHGSRLICLLRTEHRRAMSCYIQVQ